MKKQEMRFLIKYLENVAFLLLVLTSGIMYLMKSADDPLFVRVFIGILIIIATPLAWYLVFWRNLDKQLEDLYNDKRTKN